MRRLVVGITGASGVIYGVRLLSALKVAEVESHLILSQAARENIVLETDFTVDEVAGRATVAYDPQDLSAAVASGSFKTLGMVIVPCTIKTLSAVVNSFCNDLMVRAADVTLKEGRRLVLAVRETPFHRGHLDLMRRASEIGAMIVPPIPAFYHRPKTIEDIVDHTIGKILDVMQIEHSLFRRWEGTSDASP